MESLTLYANDLRNKTEQNARTIDKLKEELRRKEKGFEDKQLISNNSNKQVSDANNKLKGDLKKAMDELQELKAEADKNRAENAKAHETQMLIMVLKAKESD